MPSQPVAKFLSDRNGELSSLVERAQHLQQLSLLLQDFFRNGHNPELAEHVNLANLRENTAVLATGSPAWLNQLRYHAPAILRFLQHDVGLQELRKVQFKIQPETLNPLPRQPRRAKLSAANAELLNSTANYTGDDKLAEALRRLSLHQNS
jgi:hypothetical protein